MTMERVLAKRSELHIKRRAWHITSGVIALTLYYTVEVSLWAFVILAGVIAALGFLLDFKRFKNDRLNTSLNRFFGVIMRESEKNSFSGLPFYALGVCLTFLFFPEKIAVLSFLFLIFADPMASIFGVRFGKDRLFPNKTLQGTMAAFITCLIVTVVYAGALGVSSPNLIIFTFFCSIAGALSELLSAFNIDDNLTIPVVSGACMSLLNLWLQVF